VTAGLLATHAVASVTGDVLDSSLADNVERVSPSGTPRSRTDVRLHATCAAASQGNVGAVHGRLQIESLRMPPRLDV
jgi:hypothetical protein